MLRKDFKNLLTHLDSLTRVQKQTLLNYFKDDTSTGPCVGLIESNFENIKCCPHCGSTDHQRWGRSSRLQRFRCKDCRKTFNALTGSPLSKLRKKDQWLTYCQCLNEGLSIRKSAEICEIDPTTAFRWRHRFLSNPQGNQTQKMMGIVEADETFFTESCKGSRSLKHRPPRKRGRSMKKYRGERVPVLLVRDRNATVADCVFEHLQKNAVHDFLRPLMSDEVVLCSDGNGIYQSFSKAEGIPHKRIIAVNNEYVVDEIFHIQNLNAYTSRLKKWMGRFNGVATKYLGNYLAWRRLLEKQKENLSDKYCMAQVLGNLDQQPMQT